EFTAIINPPEAAILAVGRVTDQVKVVDGAIKPTKMMTMWLSSDHRVIDGVIAARFFGELKKLLEKPESLER
ncbi:2-oxo acid dehydrogenase subunit E2, partial [bacterium]|nr:2-oxo acid dehydrogenase subunit E2 [bacterium]